MTYEEFINNILETRGRNGCGEEYHETHHIVPKCMGGTNDKENLIDLFAREHFEAHRLLALENPDVQGLVYAWWAMSVQTNKYTKERYHITAEEYEEARKAIVNIQLGTHLSEETKRKLSEALKGIPKTEEWKSRIKNGLKVFYLNNPDFHVGQNNPNYGKKMSEESKEKMRKNHQDVSRENNPMYGRPWWDENTPQEKIDEWRKHKSEAQSGENNPFYGKNHSEDTKKLLSKMKSKIVYCIDTRKMYCSSLIAQEKTGICYSSIGKCCNNKQKTASGYQWKFLYDQTRKDGTIILGAISLGLITEEEALKQLAE